MNSNRATDATDDPGLLEFTAAVEQAVTTSRPVERRPYRQVLIAHDGTPDARAALERAPAVVSTDADVTVVTVIPFEAVGSSPDPISDEQDAWQWNCVVEATAYLRGFGIDPFIGVAAGAPAAVIRETAESLAADLVILGAGRAHGRRPSLKRRRIRPTLQRPLTCDTLVVRDAHRS